MSPTIASLAALHLAATTTRDPGPYNDYLRAQALAESIPHMDSIPILVAMDGTVDRDVARQILKRGSGEVDVLDYAVDVVSVAFRPNGSAFVRVILTCDDMEAEVDVDLKAPDITGDYLVDASRFVDGVNESLPEEYEPVLATLARVLAVEWMAERANQEA